MVVPGPDQTLFAGYAAFAKMFGDASKMMFPQNLQPAYRPPGDNAVFRPPSPKRRRQEMVSMRTDGLLRLGKRKSKKRSKKGEASSSSSSGGGGYRPPTDGMLHTDVDTAPVIAVAHGSEKDDSKTRPPEPAGMTMPDEGSTATTPTGANGDDGTGDLISV